MNEKGKWLGSKQIHCNLATKGATFGEDKQSTEIGCLI
ncbi:hypothetical protein AALP_AA1G215400 [Arabis alpina]|uniref:Uncharacterized protein n=1 Tax=Arabis alpina TaxID=50452 RepID=A0A087HPP4_ARAAL|nr:hypothetical protein AALP_AA1G215400 [Arabis alpina]